MFGLYHEENWTFHYKKTVVVPSPGPTQRRRLFSRRGDPRAECRWSSTPRDPYAQCGKHVKRKLRRQFGTARPLFNTYLVLMDAATQEPPMTSLVTASVHSRPNTREQMHTTSEFCPAVVRRPKRLFSEPTTLSYELLHWVWTMSKFE